MSSTWSPSPGDEDHVGGSTDFFYLEHSPKNQGRQRAKIKALWVPAAMSLEKGADATECDECELWRKESLSRSMRRALLRARAASGHLSRLKLDGSDVADVDSLVTRRAVSAVAELIEGRAVGANTAAGVYQGTVSQGRVVRVAGRSIVLEVAEAHGHVEQVVCGLSA